MVSEVKIAWKDLLGLEKIQPPIVCSFIFCSHLTLTVYICFKRVPVLLQEQLEGHCENSPQQQGRAEPWAEVWKWAQACRMCVSLLKRHIKRDLLGLWIFFFFFPCRSFPARGPMLILGQKVLLSEHENNSQLLFLDFSAVVTLWTIYRIDSTVSAFERCHNWAIV